ncbi:MAG: RdgB/HAM1 family non-canonical purine NTP pyrophosphatase [Schwartzia sp.]|nr:RdgB/HAM1 family non-canonical purine NTP pyrophosphatase [Schwartzia sp. (in: firmicutes)]
MKKKIVVATKNPGKVREMMNAFQNLPVELLPLSAFGDLPEAVEDGKTFAENAAIKARFYMRETGTACLADDSGLSVDALDGAPGVYSARFAGWHADDAANNEKLLAELRRLGLAESAAAYHCALAFCDTDGVIVTAHGTCPGVVRLTAKGSGGFGYDPYFYLDNGRSMAELSLAEKDAVSHRGAALREMAELLSFQFEGWEE